METSKIVRMNGRDEILIDPRLANLILEQNKLINEVKKKNKEILDLISK